MRNRCAVTARLIVAALLIASASGRAVGQETVVRELGPAPGATIDAVAVELPNATISVQGWDGDSARVELTPAEGRESLLPPVVLRDGRLLVIDPGNQEALSVVVRVPRHVDLTVRASNAGSVSVSDVHGSLELENSNAGISIEGSRGGIAAATSNGPIVAIITREPRAPMSFLTSNDPVRIVLPDGSDFDVRLETDNARVRSEFEVLPDEAAPQRRGEDPRSLRGRVGDGGPLLRVLTSNGDIVLERAGR